MIAEPLNSLIKKNIKFALNKSCKLAFEKWKQRVCEASILIHFDFSKQCHVETNLSDYVNAVMLSQKDDKSILYSAAFFSKQIVLAKCTYETYDKELLTIIRCFEE